MLTDPRRTARTIRAAVWGLIAVLWGATFGVGIFTGDWPAVWWLAIQGVTTCVLQVTAFEWAASLDAAGPSPEGVTVTLPDGRVLPLDCVYDGRTGDGLAIWRAVVPEAVADPATVRPSADVVPPKSVLHIELFRGAPREI